jgi:lysyl-tRNA synthetase, class I
MDEHVLWTDAIVKDVKERVAHSPLLQAVVKKHGYIVYDEKTPSGQIHIGSGRGWVIHDVIAKELRKAGLPAKFILSSDDMDPYDKPNKDLDESWNKYLGMSFRDIPSPVKGYKNFGDYYISQVTEKFPEWGIECELQSTGERYADGSFNPQIKIILDNADKVKKIFADLYGEDNPAARKMPFNIKCSKCYRIATTETSKWDSEKEEVFYECKSGVAKYVAGCGHSGWISPYNGNGKFPWKVEWAAKWPMIGAVFETAGKDHFSDGGSRTAACRIAVDVLGYPPPLPSNGYETGNGYEFFNIGGAKMSTSKGKGISFRDVTNYVPAKMLKFLIVKSRPNAVVDFDPHKDNDLLLLYDRYDKMEDIYFGVVEVPEEERKVQKKIYELSYIGPLPKHCPVHIPLNTASFIIQAANFDKERALEGLKKLGYKISSDAAKHEALERLGLAEKWVKDYASEQYKFEVVSERTKEYFDNLSVQERDALRLLRNRVNDDLEEKELAEALYKIKDDLGMDVKDLFKVAYKTLINKEKGPRLAPFLLSIGKEKVSEILRDA